MWSTLGIPTANKTRQEGRPPAAKAAPAIELRDLALKQSKLAKRTMGKKTRPKLETFPNMQVKNGAPTLYPY